MFPEKLRKTNIIYFLGILQLIVSLLLLNISYRFSPKIPLLERPVILFVTILIILSILYLFAVNFRLSSGNVKRLLFFIFTIGLVIRVAMLFSVPVLEDDFNRYLWDGAVSGNGINPYVYSPLQVLNEDPEILGDLKSQAGKILNNVNHPHVKTIYPPVSQFVFALSYKLAPFNLLAWKIVLLLFDLVTFFLLLYSLRIIGLSPLNVLIYWWNPLLINEIFVSGHFEVIAFPFVISAFLLINRKFVISALGSLALAAGVKLWPVFLFPLLLKMNYKSLVGLIKSSILFSIFLAAIFIPIAMVQLASSSGFVAYSQTWENNSSLFRIFLFTGEQILNYLSIHPGHAQRYTRVFVALLTIAWVLYQALKYDRTLFDLYRRSLFIVAAIFLIGPTQFPWYYTWMLPFLAVTPRFSLLFLTTLLPLYYLRYYLEPSGRLDVFNNYVVWIEFIPVWILIVLESRKKLLANF